MDRRAGSWVLAALAPAVFLAFDPGGWYPFGPAKELALAVLLVAGAAMVAAGGRWRCDPWIGRALLALLGFLVLGAAVGLDPTYAWIGTPERRFGVVTWLLAALALVVGQSLDPVHDGRRIGVGLAVAAAGVGGVATAEALGFHPGPIGLGGGRLTGTFGSAAYLGAATALLLPVALGLAADRATARPVRVLAGVGAAVLAVATVGAGARAAWVGLAVAGLVLAWCRRRSFAGHGLRVALAIALGVGALGGLAVLTPVGDRVSNAFDADAPGGRGRVDEWRVAVRVIARHPLTGVGPEGYRIAFAEGVDERYERAHGRDPLPDRAHSTPLDVALAGGIGAVAAWLALVGLVGRSVLRALRDERRWVVGLAAGVLAFTVGELLLFPTAELDPVAWLLAGLVVAASRTAAPALASAAGAAPVDSDADPDPSLAIDAEAGSARSLAREPGPGPRDRRAPRGASVLLAGAAVVGAVVGVSGVVADRRAQRAVEALAAGDGAAAARSSGSAVALRPDVLRYHLLDARARVAAGEGQVAAIAAVDEGLEVSPRDPIARRARVRALIDRARATTVPAHAAAARRAADGLVADDPLDAAGWELVGGAASAEGDAEGAVAAFRRAERLAPRDPGPATELALVYRSLERIPDARAAIGRALAIDPDDPRAVAVAAGLPAG